MLLCLAALSHSGLVAGPRRVGRQLQRTAATRDVAEELGLLIEEKCQSRGSGLSQTFCALGYKEGWSHRAVSVVGFSSRVPPK